MKNDSLKGMRKYVNPLFKDMVVSVYTLGPLLSMSVVSAYRYLYSCVAPWRFYYPSEEDGLGVAQQRARQIRRITVECLEKRSGVEGWRAATAHLLGSL